MGVSRPFLSAILAQVFFIQFAWQAYICPRRLHQSWNDEQIYVLLLKIHAFLNGLS